MALITCQNLSLGYDGKAVLQNLSFSVHAGEYLCIIGENGTGKTTLMKTLLQLQQCFHQRGLSSSILSNDTQIFTGMNGKA